MQPTTYLRITRASALYDIVQILPFATPWSFALFHGQLSHLNVWLGGAPLPAFAPLHFVPSSLLGALVLLWSLYRLGSPSRRLGRFDAAGRLVFAFWIGWGMLQARMPVLWIFLLPEVAWGVLEAMPVAQPSGSRTLRAAFRSAAPMRSRRGG